MSEQDCRVLYAKYNPARKPEYRITTEICEDESGLFVRKRPGEDAARVHLDNIYENSVALRDYYRDIRVIPVQRMDDALKFPYINGKTLAEQIETRQFDRKAFVARVNEQLDKVLSVQEKYVVPFEMTEGFEATFGKVEISDMLALNPANIDSLLTNFIETDAGTYCIDCEWVCRFPVPIGYIRYRILRYLYLDDVGYRLQGASLEEMLGWFGISGNMLDAFREMEKCFQQRIHGGSWKYTYTENYRKKDLSIVELDRELQAIVADNAVKEAYIREQNAQIKRLTVELEIISNSFFWRMTKPARVALDALKRTVRGHEPIYLFCRTAKDTTRHGFRYAWQRCRSYINDKKRISGVNHWPTGEEQAKQQQKSFSRDITFSILVPLYNTPEAYLRAMIQSVLDQTYEKWELCLADGSDGEHGYVQAVCGEYADRDPRIRYKKLEKNLGICGNTNACIGMATGDYLALFDHDDVLHPSALYENMVAICEKDADFIYSDEITFRKQLSNMFNPHFKPDYAPDTLRANNYICHFTVFRRELLEKAGGGFRPEFEGSQDFDMVLRLTEQAERIVHIPRILYYWRAHSNSVAESVSAKPYVIEAAKRAIAEHLKRVGLEGEALDSAVPSIYRLKYRIQGEPLISILIPNTDHVDDLRRCVNSIRTLSTYSNWEIIVIENNSHEASTFAFYDELPADPRIRVIKWEGKFNYSEINNFGREAKGEHILLLNNDTEVISPDWLQEMLMYSQRPDVGAVGAKLYYPDHTIQHAGLGIGMLTLAGRYHHHFNGNHPGYMGRLSYAQNVSGVTAACMMLPRRVYEAMNGLDESFEGALNAVDLCMRIRRAGYLIVFTPFAELYHYESKSRESDASPEERKRFMGEAERFQRRWSKELAAGDPYYNPNFTLDKEDFSIR